MSQDILELGIVLIICVFIIAGLQWFLLRFTHWSVALGGTALLAVFISFLYVSLKYATPNGGNNAPDFSEYVTPTLVVLISLLFGLLAVVYFSKAHFPKTTFISLFAFIAVLALSRNIYLHIQNITASQDFFTSCNIEVINNSKKELVREIGFKNTSNSLVNSIQPIENQQSYSFFPREANQIFFRCTSAKKGIFFQNFPFDYSKCKEKKGKIFGIYFWLRLKAISPIKIILQPDNKVELYIDNRIAQQYQLKDGSLQILDKHRGKYR